MPLLVILTAIIALALLMPESLLLNRYLLPRISAVEFDNELFLKFARRSIVLLLPLALPLAAYLATAVSARLNGHAVTLETGKESRTTLRFFFIMFAVPYALHSALYLTGIFYGYAISDHHIIYLTPLVALFAVASLELIPETTTKKLAAAAMLFCLFLISAVRIGQDVPNRRGIVDLERLSDYELLVVDNVGRLTLFNYMDPEGVVFAGHQPDLLAQPEKWLPRLAEEGGVYVSLVHNGTYAIGDVEGRDKIVELIAQNSAISLLGSLQEGGTLVSVYEVGQ